MKGEIAGSFIYNGKPQNGASAKLWKITGFASYAASGATVQDNPLAAGAIELNSSDGALFAVGDIIKVDDELMRVWLISTNLLFVVRGYRGTTPASHTQNTAINDETITAPAQDAAEPSAGYQQGSSITTGVSYGGDGAYRWTAIPEGEYYVSVYYDNHRAWLYASVEINDVTPEQVLTTQGDVLIRGSVGVKRLAKGADGTVLKMGATEPAWGVGVATIASGNYAGDNTANKAIAHGLGAIPKAVFIVAASYQYQILIGYAFIRWLSTAPAYGGHAVTAPTSTNFYVGNATDYGQSANATGTTYYWVAIG